MGFDWITHCSVSIAQLQVHYSARLHSNNKPFRKDVHCYFIHWHFFLWRETGKLNWGTNRKDDKKRFKVNNSFFKYTSLLLYLVTQSWSLLEETSYLVRVLSQSHIQPHGQYSPPGSWNSYTSTPTRGQKSTTINTSQLSLSFPIHSRKIVLYFHKLYNMHNKCAGHTTRSVWSSWRLLMEDRFLILTLLLFASKDCFH